MELETQAPQQAKSKKWIFLAIGGALVLLCLCLSAAAVIVLPRLAKNISQLITSYKGIADEQLKSDTLNLITQYEQATYGCGNVTLFAGIMMLRPDQTNNGSWSEIWQVIACGASHMYNITFTPDGAGGTYISASQIDDK